MSLRDELLKAGLVSADKIKQLESDARNQQHQRKKNKTLAAEETARQAEAGAAGRSPAAGRSRSRPQARAGSAIEPKARGGKTAPGRGRARAPIDRWSPPER